MKINHHYSNVLDKYRKFKLRLDRAMQNGSFARYTYRKRRMLLKRLDRIRRQLEQLSSKWKLAGAGAMALGAMALATPEAQAQDDLQYDGSEFQVNTHTTNGQTQSDVASDASGNYVVVWSSWYQDGHNAGIYGQRYDNTGSAVGVEFLVNTTTALAQHYPEVAMDADGDFVVVWQSFGQDGGDYGIFAQRYDNNGDVVGSEFQVNTVPNSYQKDPSIAMDSDGDFIIAWTSNLQDGSYSGVYAQRYTNAGLVDGVEFQVNTQTTNDQRRPSVAMSSDGAFIIAWEAVGQSGGSDWDIVAQMYDNTGTTVGSEFMVNTQTAYPQNYPSAGMDDSGDFVVAWASGYPGGYGYDYDVFARRYDNTGTPDGSEFQVNTNTTDSQYDPSISVDTDGDFVIAWRSDEQDEYGSGIFAQRYDNTGAAVGSEFQANTYSYASQSEASVFLDDDGDFTVAWTESSYREDPEDWGSGIVAQRFTLGTAAAPTDISLSSSNIEDNTGAGVEVGTLTATDPDVESHSFTLVSGDGDDNNDNFVISGNSLQTNSFIDYETQPSQSIRIQVEDESGFTFEKAFTITVDDVADVPGLNGGSEYKVNTYTDSYNQGPSAIAMDDDGNYVVVWASNDQDGDEYGIYGQRYDNTGAAVGSEFQVNTYTDYSQENPSVAMDADGDFVVVWQSKYGPMGQEIFAQRFNNSGTAVGSEFRVNSFTSSNQVNPDVAMDADGNFVVTWEGQYDQDLDGDGVFAQRFGNDGIAIGSEFQVNSYTDYDQGNPAVAMDADGDFVVVWQSYYQDGEYDGIYAQRYDNTGVAAGSEFLVNTYTTSYQQNPDVAMDDDGDFVVVWSSYYQDGEYYGIYAQRFDTDGVAAGSEFKVNTYEPYVSGTGVVAMDADGDFVIVWRAEYYDDDDNWIYGTASKLYDSSGTELDSDLALEFYYGEDDAAVAMDPSGNFTVAGTGYSNDGGYYDLYAKNYILNVAPTALALDNDNINENEAVGTAIGNLSSTDANGSDSHTYFLVSGTGDTDNGSFTIVGDELQSGASFDYETQSSYSIRVRTTDAGGLYTEDTFTVSINDLDDVLGIEDIGLSTNIYPNPGSDLVHLEMKNNFRGMVQIRVLDLSGKLIQ